MSMLRGLAVFAVCTLGLSSIAIDEAKEEIIARLSPSLEGISQPQPLLILIGGYVASGKTTLSTALHERYDMTVFSLNSIRQALLDEGIDIRSNKPEERRVFREVYPRLLAPCITNRQHIVIDANANRQGLQDALRFLRETPGGDAYEVVKVHLQASEEELYKRVRARVQKSGMHMGTESDLTYELTTPAKAIYPEDYDMVIDTENTPVEDEIEKVHKFIALSQSKKLGFGTYPLKGEVCMEAVKQAYKDGYRIFDTATYYRNFDAIAEALKGKERSSYSIISKVWHSMHAPEHLRKDLEWTLEQLKTDYLDTYLLHWPNSGIPIEKTLLAMDELRKAGKIRRIGLSNVSVNHVKRALEVGVPIHSVQVEMHPQFYDPELLQFCQERSIQVQAWAPLGRGRISEDTALAKIGEKYGKTASQVALRWIIQHGCLPLPGSKSAAHIHENREVLDFALSPEEMAAIDERAKQGERERFTKERIGFTDEFDFTYEECWPK